MPGSIRQRRWSAHRRVPRRRRRRSSSRRARWHVRRVEESQTEPERSGRRERTPPSIPGYPDSRRPRRLRDRRSGSRRGAGCPQARARACLVTGDVPDGGLRAVGGDPPCRRRARGRSGSRRREPRRGCPRQGYSARGRSPDERRPTRPVGRHGDRAHAGIDLLCRLVPGRVDPEELRRRRDDSGCTAPAPGQDNARQPPRRLRPRRARR